MRELLIASGLPVRKYIDTWKNDDINLPSYNWSIVLSFGLNEVCVRYFCAVDGFRLHFIYRSTELPLLTSGRALAYVIVIVIRLLHCKLLGAREERIWIVLWVVYCILELSAIHLNILNVSLRIPRKTKPNPPGSHERNEYKKISVKLTDVQPFSSEEWSISNFPASAGI